MARANFRLRIVSAILTAIFFAGHWCLVIGHFSLCILMDVGALVAQQQPVPQIYWGDEVPAGWNGDWPKELKTVPEKTGYTRTISTRDLHDWIAALKTKSDNVHVFEMFTSPLKKVAPAMVLANPRVSSRGPLTANCVNYSND